MSLNGRAYHKAHFVGGPLNGQELQVPLLELIEVEEHHTLNLKYLKGRLQSPDFNTPPEQKIHQYRLMYGYYQYSGTRVGY